jgi:hypothetical protein
MKKKKKGIKINKMEGKEEKIGRWELGSHLTTPIV